MKFKYYLENNAGWAGFSVEDNDIHLEYSISYFMGDSLEELLCCLIAFSGYNCHLNIVNNLIEKYLNEYDYSFKWTINQEGSTIWFLFEKTEKNGIVNLKIIENYEEQKCVFNKDIIIDDFIKDILFSCNEMLQKYGIIGYYKNFWIEFPISYYLMLKDYTNEKIKFGEIKEIIGEKEYELFTTNIEEEINYLKKI
jgi:hypothetical protein